MKPIDLPPIFPNIQNLLTDYLICLERLPIHEYKHNQEFWGREPQIDQLLDYDVTPCSTTLKVQRDPITGKVTEFREVLVSEVGINAKNSMSFHRAPAPLVDGCRGDPTNIPFWPGGFSEPVLPHVESNDSEFSELLTIPPGFKEGLSFESPDFHEVVSNSDSRKSKQISISAGMVNLMELVQQEQDLLGLWKDNTAEETVDENKDLTNKVHVDVSDLSEIISESDIPILNISSVSNIALENKNSEWAVMLDVNQPVLDFHERIPNMAHKYPFELDTFQKQAILKLEEKCDILVAAHTSAGKTVVADYAIALSQQHGTRSIYTSPIKALSNQKYRDFQKTFRDVGLVTGDFQINPTAGCLIMTTEILRSMLYCGSEVIRDLEYVIFDEVHYINDTERGHVWEEVMILLPDNVRIVLLSATVPNTMEFASWLGMTKKRKVYVIKTLHRPVPLQHYLYTGLKQKSEDEKYKIMDNTKKFLIGGHADAKKSLYARNDNKEKPFHVKMHLDSTALTTLIKHLKKNSLLPAVIFTFSRVMCDRMALKQEPPNLITPVEKRIISEFYSQCIQLLKPPDKNLPQVQTVGKILQKGIGVHHSGILPIIKEIIEMLFQKGLIKVLFATETFAMGVNMPAKTVVFNSLEKFDGTELRFLKPAEYTQMAGRAGRRGLDKFGTVIIRCANKIPDIQTLQQIMSAEPEKLESKFRLTYSMLLSLFRAESFSVESMMSHSFCEMPHMSRYDQLHVTLERTKQELNLVLSKDIGGHLQHLFDFYTAASDYIEAWKSIHPTLVQQPSYIKDLVPGRVVLVSYKSHYKKLGILLNLKKISVASYKILVLDNQKQHLEEDEEDMPNDWYQMLSFTYDYFQPEGIGGHVVLDVPTAYVILTQKTIKVDYDLVLRDWNNRQIPRFRDNPPSQTCQHAIQELLKLSTDFSDENLHNIFAAKDLELFQQLEVLKFKHTKLVSMLHHTKIANFEEQFVSVFKRKHLEAKLKKLEFQLSSGSLMLYEDYKSRIEILKQLKYVDEENRVNLKGQFSCRIGMNELLITELVFRNTLTELQPAEIAALLSALMYQVNVKEEQTFDHLPTTLRQGVMTMIEIHQEIKRLESIHKVMTLQENLNFELVEVVYEWARDKPFSDIMRLTTVQEGIIVRCIQQLNETLKNVRDAASIIGVPVLKTKMEEASNAIKRDIVFAASLYTQRECPDIDKLVVDGKQEETEDTNE